MALRYLPRIAAGSLLLAGGLFFIGCSSGRSTTGAASGGGTASTPTPTPGAAPVQVGIGDAPSDWVMAFGMTVNSIMLTNSTGGTVSVMPTATPTEVMQLMATVQPVSSTSVPQGTYTQAQVTMSAITMGYMDPTTHAYTQKTMAGPFTATVPFSPSMTVGSAPVALNFDMNMGSSVSVDGSGNVTFKPVMTAGTASVSSGSPNPWQGGMQHQVGTVSSVSGSSFTMGSMMGLQNAAFKTDSTTQFSNSGLAGMGQMASGMMVAVDASLQADGTYLAHRIENMQAGATGMMGSGLVSSVTGNPASQLTLVANGGMGGGMMASSIAGTIAVSLPSTVPYSIDTNGVDLAGLPFAPAFSASNLVKGQRVDVVSTSGMMSGGASGSGVGMGSGGMGSGSGMMGSLGTVAATQVRLEQQALHGTVSNYTANGKQASFTLTLPSDSAFATLTGATTVLVYQQAGTQVSGIATTVANGNDVQARGLLFHDGGIYKLVTTWIVAR